MLRVRSFASDIQCDIAKLYYFVEAWLHCNIWVKWNQPNWSIMVANILPQWKLRPYDYNNACMVGWMTPSYCTNLKTLSASRHTTIYKNKMSILLMDCNTCGMHDGHIFVLNALSTILMRLNSRISSTRRYNRGTYWISPAVIHPLKEE